MIPSILKSMLLIYFLVISTVYNTAIANQDQRLFKAAFIYNFAKFTRWPKNLEDDDKDKIVLCTLGEDQLVIDLTRLQGKIINNKILIVKTIEAPNECGMLYIAASKKRNYVSTLNHIRGKPILTISEIKNFAQSGGIIELNLEKGQTRITINLNAAHENNLELSSRLLILANIINDKPSK